MSERKEEQEEVEDEVVRGVKALREHLDSHNNNRKEVQRELHEACEKWRKEADELERKTSHDIEVAFSKEKDCLQKALESTCESSDSMLKGFVTLMTNGEGDKKEMKKIVKKQKND